MVHILTAGKPTGDAVQHSWDILHCIENIVKAFCNGITSLGKMLPFSLYAHFPLNRSLILHRVISIVMKSNFQI